jgi:hypothetical protein
MNKYFTKNMLFKIAFIIFTLILVIFVGISLWIYTSTYQPLESIDYEVGLTDNVYYEISQEYYEFGNINELKNSEYGFIFYPGGLVEAESYATLCIEIASRGYNCYIALMPLNLAILNIDAGDNVINNNPTISKWIIGGHSLGGVMACRYANSRTDSKIISIFLLASYCDQKVNDSQVKVVSIIGSEDKVLNLNSYNDAKTNLPSSSKYITIEGANHSQFGNYGLQKGDGLSTITQQEQTRETVDYIVTNLY